MNAVRAVKILTGLVAVLALAGCGPIPIHLAKPVSAERYLHESANTVPVTIVRDSGFPGAPFAVKVMVNDLVAAYVGDGEKVTLHIPPGEYILGAVMGLSVAEVEANLQLGRPKSYRIGINAFGIITFSPTMPR